MHPAFSVIVFTALSGLGYGVWIWSGAALFFGRGAHGSLMHLMAIAAGAVPVAAGLLSSTLHLGRPRRVWRAFSQWRSSWLSREGVLAVLTFFPWAFLAWSALFGEGVPFALWMAALATLILLSLGTVFCTAMIYASLAPVPAWRHGAVVPGYFGFALLTGGLVSTASFAGSGEWPGAPAAIGLPALALALGGLKWRYWRDLDRAPLPVSRASALGLPADRRAGVFERPHTEASYLTTEMGFVLARKHSRRLRAIALVLFSLLPAVLVPGALWSGLLPQTGLLWAAAASALLGAVVERWLFFAEAKHLVTLYY